MRHFPNRVLSSELFWSGLAVVLMAAACVLIAGGLLMMPVPLVVAGVLAILGCGVILGNPYWGIVLFLALVYLRPETVVPKIASLRLPLTLSSFTLFAWVVQLMLNRETFRWRTELAWIVAFSVAVTLSAVKVPGSDTTMAGFLQMAKLTLFFLMVQQLVNTEKRAAMTMNFVLLFVVGIALLGIHGYVTGTSVIVEKQHGARAMVKGGEFDDPNDLAAALVVLVPFALLLVTRGKRALSRVWGTAALGILILGVYVTNSRGGMVALGVALGVFLVYHLGWAKGLAVAAAAAGLMLAFGPGRFSPETLSATDDSAMGRLLAWEAGLNMFARDPLLGVGFDQFKELYLPVPAAHNSFVQGLAEGGFLTAVTWVGLNYWALLSLSRLRRARRKDPAGEDLEAMSAALQAGLLAALTAGLFLSHTFRLIPLVPVALAAALAGLGGEPLRPSIARDWPHFLAVLGLTCAGIGLLYGIVTVLLP